LASALNALKNDVLSDVLKVGHVGNTCKVLKCGSGEGWRRSVEPIV
jgi:hypothetical protein